MGIDSLGSLFLLKIKFERIEKGKNQGFLKLVSILSLFLTFIINTKPILEDGVFFLFDCTVDDRDAAYPSIIL
jgi:hypothetical protein